jgi:hypothetical protein
MRMRLRSRLRLRLLSRLRLQLQLWLRLRLRFWQRLHLSFRSRLWFALRFVVFCRFVLCRVVLVSFVGILGPTGSHRRANGSFWMPFWTKGDARQDGKQSNKLKK